MKRLRRIFFQIQNGVSDRWVDIVLVMALLLCLCAVFPTAYVLMSAIMIGSVILAIDSPKTALIMFVAYTPFEPFLLKFVPDAMYVFVRYAPEVLIYVLLASVAVRVWWYQKKKMTTPLDGAFIGLLFVALLSVVLNMVPFFDGILGIRQIMRFMLLFFIAVYLSPGPKYIRGLSIMMGVIVLGESALGIAQALTGGALDPLLLPSQTKELAGIQLTQGTDQFWAPGSRVFATLGRYDQLGTFLSLFMSLAVGLLYFVRKQGEKWALRAMLAISGIALILSLSRASWFGFALGVLVIAGYFMKDWRVRIGALAFVVVAVGYVAVTGLAVKTLVETPNQGVVSRFFESFSWARYSGEYYGMGRVFWFVNTPKVVASSPIIGVGPSMYGGGAVTALHNTKVYDQLGLPFGVYGTQGYIDNNWLSIWGEVGTVGLFFYLAMMVILWRMALQVWRNAQDPYTRGLALGYIGVIIAVALQGFLGTALEIRTLASYFWLYGGFIYVLGRREGVWNNKRIKKLTV